MTNSEINEFLGDFTLSPQQTKREYIYLSDFNIYEKSVLIRLSDFTVKEPQTMNQLAKDTSCSITSIKRAIVRLKRVGLVIHHPTKSGYILNITNTLFIL